VKFRRIEPRTEARPTRVLRSVSPSRQARLISAERDAPAASPGWIREVVAEIRVRPSPVVDKRQLDDFPAVHGCEMTRLRIAASSRVPPQTACQTGTPPTRFGKSRPASTAHGLTTTVPTWQILPIVYTKTPITIGWHRCCSYVRLPTGGRRP